MTKKLPIKVYNAIVELSKEGEVLFDKHEYLGAIEKFRQALNKVPSPTEHWDTSTWINTAIGDCYFKLKDFDKSLQFNLDAFNCPGGKENPFVNLRIGQGYYESNQIDKAEDFLLRAYIIEGETLFNSENKKYFRFLENKLNL